MAYAAACVGLLELLVQALVVSTKQSRQAIKVASHVCFVYAHY